MQGSLDIPLNERGIAQADAAATRFMDKGGLGIKAIYSSDLSRAALTAERIAKAMGWPEPVLESAELREWNLGVLQGHTHAEGQHKFGEVMEGMHADDDFVI